VKDVALGKESSKMADSESQERRDEQEQQKWHERTRFQVILFVVGVVLFILVVGFILDWYIDPQEPTQRKDLAQTLGLITAGTAGAVGIFFTWRGQRFDREAQAENQTNTLEQLKQARNELELHRRGQITERFTAAIDQLGKTNDDGTKNMEVRLGAIYSLERTAREDRDFHWPIIEILTSYVRQHSPRILDQHYQPPNRVHEQAPLPPEPDILAILTIIGRRAIYHKDVEYGPIDLHAANLRRANLRGADLQAANLRDSDIWGTDLRGANLRGASLVQCDLRGALLTLSDLRETLLQGSQLDYADLRECDLGDAFLDLAVLSEADLRGADTKSV
jgi:Pentapeptide repeats (8 copies)